MMFNFAGEFKRELMDMGKMFQDNIYPWWEDIYIYIRRLDNDFTWNTLPIVVLSIYKFIGIERSFSIQMANIFKMVYFTNSIHAYIKDDTEGQEYNRELQFNILIGDYFFGRVLKQLNDLRADKLLPLFSKLICEINEGMVMKHRLGAADNEVLEKTKASFYSTAFLTAAELTDIEGQEKELLAKLGNNIGMALELLNDKAPLEDIYEFVDFSELFFKEINQKRMLTNSNMEKLIKELHDITYGIEKVVVV